LALAQSLLGTPTVSVFGMVEGVGVGVGAGVGA
jgi:hypothetical protein